MLACARNVQAVQEGRSLSESLAATPAELRAATQAITFHVMRHAGLAHEIKQELVARTPPNPWFDALMLVSLALLETAMDAEQVQQAGRTVPREWPVYAVHTVVDQAVAAAAGQTAMRSYKGLLNATLRRFTRERDAILAQARKNPEARWNHPDWWIRLLRRAYPGQWQALLEAANQPAPMILRVNRRRATVEQVLAALDEAGIEARAVGASGIALAASKPVQAIPGFAQGWWSVQDASAQKAAELLAPASGMRVLDACCAPGGKAAHLLELADIDLTAIDSDAGRLARVEQNLERLGLGGGRVVLKAADASNLDAWWDGRPFDAVLADVPCTASGIVRRHPDIRWLRREGDIAKTAALQRKIVNALWKTVKPGGRLLYATCSIFPQEGEQQASRFLESHADAVRLPAPGQLLPAGSGEHDFPSDGFFYALFARQA
jgi:16S rRNA (cytosine967-C5)-methyltransferase